MIAVGVGLTTATGAALAQEKINIALFSWPGYAWWFVAKEKNLAPDLDLNIQIIEDPYQSFALMASGGLDVASSTMEYAPIAGEAGHPIKIVGVTTTCHGSDNIILAPGMKSAADVKGKKIIAMEGGLSQIYVGWWLEQNGVDANDAEYVNVIMDDAASAMIAGEAAAGEFWEPFGSMVLKGLEGSTVASNCKEPFWLKTALLSDAMFMRSDFISDRRDVAVKVMRAYWDAVAYWLENPDEAAQIMADGLKFDIKDVEAVIGPHGDRTKSLLWIYDFMQAASFCGVAPGKAPFGQANGQIYQVMNWVNDWWLKFGHMKNRVAPARYVDCSLMRELYETGYAGDPEPNY